MSKVVDPGTPAHNWSSDARTLMGSTHSADLKWGPLCLLVFGINIAVVMLAWLLVGLLN
jgi:hypothetical protein